MVRYKAGMKAVSLNSVSHLHLRLSSHPTTSTSYPSSLKTNPTLQIHHHAFHNHHRLPLRRLCCGSPRRRHRGPPDSQHRKSLPSHFTYSPHLTLLQAKTVRVQLSNDAVDAAQQAEIAVGSKVAIQPKFGGLGNPAQANRALVVSSSGTCQIFKDTAGKQLIATIKAGAADAIFGNTKLGKGVIVCK
jgi:hypothetical protein